VRVGTWLIVEVTSADGAIIEEFDGKVFCELLNEHAAQLNRPTSAQTPVMIKSERSIRSA